MEAAGITLHHEVPERLARIGNEPRPLAIASPRRNVLRMRAVIGPQRRQRGFQTLALPAECGGFFLAELERELGSRILERQHGARLPTLNPD